MKPDAKTLVVELYLAIERATGKGSVHKARAAARLVGATFDNTDAARWLAEFTQASAQKRHAFQHDSSTVNEHETAQNQNDSQHENRLTRDKVIPSNPISSASLRSALPAPPTQAGQEPKPAPKTSPPKSLRLPLDAELHDAARAILAAVWGELGATAFSATMTKTEWGRRNHRAAMDLARSGILPARCVEAWRSAGERIGAPVRTLAIVQDELGRLAAAAPVLRVVPDAEQPAWLVQSRIRAREDYEQRKAAEKAAERRATA